MQEVQIINKYISHCEAFLQDQHRLPATANKIKEKASKKYVGNQYALKNTVEMKYEEQQYIK